MNEEEELRLLHKQRERELLVEREKPAGWILPYSLLEDLMGTLDIGAADSIGSHSASVAIDMIKRKKKALDKKYRILNTCENLLNEWLLEFRRAESEKKKK